jgi:crotonobetainyl-CoA:carnitine CoA-transferase CaiB-like acyl-CoA transferase
MCHLTGYPDDFPCGIGGTWPDFAVGTAMVFFILAALHHRDQTGEGQYLDLSMAEAVTAMLPEAMMDYFLNWRDNGPIGNRDPAMAPHGVFPVKGDDQWIAIAIANDEEFGALCEALGVPAFAKEPRFSRLASRLANVEDLEREIAARTREFDRDDLVRLLRSRDLAVGPVYGPMDLMEDPALRDSGMLIELEHPESGSRIVPGLPVTFSAMQPDYQPAPAMGQDSEQVLGELLGYSSAEIARLRDAKVVI